MTSEPMPWDDNWPALFRLPGFGGYAWSMRTTIFPVADGETESGQVTLGVDISLLSPFSDVTYLCRDASPDLFEALSDFFMRAASDWQPETTLPPFHDDEMGLEVRITSSRQARVRVVVRIAEDAEAEAPDFTHLEFETSRSVLAKAALDVRVLTSVEDEPEGNLEPPEDWTV